MTWQDIVITVANILFTVSIIPQVYSGFTEKSGPIKLQTSIPTFVGLFAISYTFWTLSLSFSAVTSFLSGIMWLLLFVQRLMYKK